jgi:hypothetical protein
MPHYDGRSYAPRAVRENVAPHVAQSRVDDVGRHRLQGSSFAVPVFVSFGLGENLLRVMEQVERVARTSR